MTTKQSTWKNDPATDAQKAMIVKLRDKKATDENPVITDEKIAALTKGEVDFWKNYIFSLPWPVKKAEVSETAPASTEVKKFDDYADIVDGNYAYDYNGKTHFYRVTRETPKAGKWAGKTFIKVQERASDELYKVYDYKMKKAILTTIRETGVEFCQKNFAAKLGRCWRCGKTLTDEFNPYKSQGLGPDCGTQV